MSQMKEQDKNPEKQPNDLGIGNFPGKKKKTQNKNSEDDPVSHEKN